MRLAALFLLIASPLSAQVLQGVVRDSVARQPVPGVVVSLIDSAGKPTARTLSDQRGLYRLVVRPGAALVRVQRLGYRMREVPMIATGDDVATLDLLVAAIPSLLEPVRVLGAARCPRRRDNAEAQALYDQARSGLLATIVARESNPASLVRYAFDRPTMLWPDSAPPSVRIDSANQSTISFKALFSGEEFVQRGFQQQVGDQWQYFGPDAEVLLDDGFAEGYCFRIADRDRARSNLIGLSFEAATKQKGRVDILGTLWIDTIARALRTIEYKYGGYGSLADYRDTGGRTDFRELPNGVVIVTQWGLRMVSMSRDSIEDKFGNKRAASQLVLNESGGFLAKASWPDGTRWVAPMGAARLRLMVNDSTPAIGALVTLANTDYRAVSDTSGMIEIPDLFPGRYRVIVRDTLLEELGFETAPSAEFVAAAGATTDGRVRVRSTAELLLQRCFNKTSRADLVAVVNVRDAAVGAGGVKVDFDLNGAKLSETTRSYGNIVLCFDRSALGATITMTGRRGDMTTQTIAHTINRRVTLFRLQLAKRSPLP
jgi:hypothetical protein